MGPDPRTASAGFGQLLNPAWSWVFLTFTQLCFLAGLWAFLPVFFILCLALPANAAIFSPTQG